MRYELSLVPCLSMYSTSMRSLLLQVPRTTDTFCASGYTSSESTCTTSSGGGSCARRAQEPGLHTGPLTVHTHQCQA